MRTDHDSMGDVEVPDDALYGASTQRAADNFDISGRRFGRRFVWALGLIKASAARVAGRQGLLDEDTAAAIAAAADEVAAGRHDDQFVVDVFQTGSGTSTNTNANEVIANLATLRLGGELGAALVHPNDDVNLGQSSNDVIPTAIHVAAVAAVHDELLPALRALTDSLWRKSEQFDGVVKSGRTHLMDATPVTLGQEFSGYATQVDKGVLRIEAALGDLLELALGGTAVGTGINAPDGFAEAVIAEIAERTGRNFREADNHFEAQAAKDAAVQLSGCLKTVATSLFKIANDLRWLASGPRTGLAEISLPAVQPGSSIMPGKVNPVMSEALMQVCAQVVGNDAAITWGGANGNFELNAMMPVIAVDLLESIEILGRAADAFRVRCVEGIEADEVRARELAERNIIVVTALNPRIGYDRGAEAAKEALATGRNVADVVVDRGWLTRSEVDELLDLRRMTEGGVTSVDT